MDEGIFVGYSSKRKEYKCYNVRLGKVVETINVKIDESILSPDRQEDFDEQDEGEIIQEEEEEENQEEEQKDEKESEEGRNQQVPQNPSKTPNRLIQRNHPVEQIIGDRSTGMETRRRKQVQTRK